MSWFNHWLGQSSVIICRQSNLLKYNNQEKINKPTSLHQATFWLVKVGYLCSLLITGAMNTVLCRDICLGMLFKTCEVRTVRRRDNPPSDALIVTAPSFLRLALHLCVAHLFTTLPGWRAASAAEWNDNVPSLYPIYALTLTLIHPLSLLLPLVPPPFLSKSVQTLQL